MRQGSAIVVQIMNVNSLVLHNNAKIKNVQRQLDTKVTIFVKSKVIYVVKNVVKMKNVKENVCKCMVILLKFLIAVTKTTFVKRNVTIVMQLVSKANLKNMINIFVRRKYVGKSVFCAIKYAQKRGMTIMIILENMLLLKMDNKRSKKYIYADNNITVNKNVSILEFVILSTKIRRDVGRKTILKPTIHISIKFNKKKIVQKKFLLERLTMKKTVFAWQITHALYVVLIVEVYAKIHINIHLKSMKPSIGIKNI